MMILPYLLLALTAAQATPTEGTAPAEGLTVFLHDNGMKAREGRLVDGRRQGLWKGWHKNGAQAYEGAFDGYQRIGRWT